MKVKRATRAQGNRRLLKLAAFLEKLPRKRFDYSSYVGMDWEGAPDLSCGTTACAAGWATTIPEFRKLGLRMLNMGTSMPLPVNIEKVFGLDRYEDDFLFIPNTIDGRFGSNKRNNWHSPNSNATAKQVAKHIRRFVKERK